MQRTDKVGDKGTLPRKDFRKDEGNGHVDEKADHQQKG
jgi:hypothetical protein